MSKLQIVKVHNIMNHFYTFIDRDCGISIDIPIRRHQINIRAIFAASKTI
jgi:hypothetical protein